MVDDPLFVVIIIACLIVAAILAWGVSLFGKGGDAKQANRVMQYRIAAQFVAVIVIVGIVWLRSLGGN